MRPIASSRRPFRRLASHFTLLVIFLALPLAVRAQDPYPRCLLCHGNLENVAQSMGWNGNSECTYCHGGDPNATDMFSAHVQPLLPPIMDATTPPRDYDLAYQQFINPSNLRVVDYTCGGCHEEITFGVKKSMMATAAGHYAGGLYQCGAQPTRNPVYGTFAVVDDDGFVPAERGAVESLADLVRYDPAGDPQDFATHFEAVPGQACARCHLWSRGAGYRGAANQRGLYRADGCAACHMIYHDDGLSQSADASIDHAETGHPMHHAVTRAIPTSQCLHCHQRGARIGVSFTGRSEMPPRLPAGPGVPGTTGVLFGGQYHYATPDTNPPDIHHERGLHCVDCHTKKEIMGDGNIYGHMDQATRIECSSCHGRPESAPTLADDEGESLRNVAAVGDVVTLTSKVTGETHVVKRAMDVTNPRSPLYNPRAACAMNGNHIKPQGGLECYACHASWTVNCYGCHFERDERYSGLNLVSREMEIGRVRTNNKVFESFRSFQMGPNSGGRVAPYVVGCQPIADVTAPDGSKILDYAMPTAASGASGLALNPVNPHTTRGAGWVRDCAECHRAPPTLGMGSGNYALARTFAYVAGGDGVIRMNRWAQPEHPAPAGILSSGAALAVAALPNAIEGTADYLYVARGAAGVEVYDLRGDGPPRLAASVAGIDARDVSRVARYVYVVVAGVGVMIFDNDNPEILTPIATIDAPAARRAVPWGIHLFIAAGQDGLIVVDVGDHANPAIIATLGGMNLADVRPYAHYQPGSAFASRLYAADPDFGVRIIDLLPDFAAPRLVGGLPLPGASGLDTYARWRAADAVEPSREHDYLYVAAGPGGLHVFDMTAPDQIVEVGAVAAPAGDALHVDVASQIAPPGANDYALVADRNNGLLVVNVTDPTSPQLVATVPAAGAARVFVEVQQLDRYLDEQGNPLRESSHPFTGSFAHDDLVRILRASLDDCGPPRRGDANCDGAIDNGDIDAFVTALLDADLYAMLYPNCRIIAADANWDGVADNGDIDAFVALLLGP